MFILLFFLIEILSLKEKISRFLKNICKLFKRYNARNLFPVLTSRKYNIKGVGRFRPCSHFW